MHSIHRQCPEWGNPEERKADWRVPEAGEVGGEAKIAKGWGFFLRR